MTAPTTERTTDTETELVGIGQPKMPMTERDPATGRYVPTTFPVYRAHAPWGKVGELWFNPRTKQWLAYRFAVGAYLNGSRDTKEDAAAVVDWTIRTRTGS